MLRLADHWVWDSWLAVAGDEFHLFFLRASRALHDPERRHLRAAIGHAVSTDLREWTLLADALVHADQPAWDESAVWTGSVVRGPDGRWYLFYTGVQVWQGVPVQRIGLAVSTDLHTWRRHGEEPVLEPDQRWYRCLGPGMSETWRDPFVFRDAAGRGWHMLLTAHAPDGGGVIGHARSADLLHWQVCPPVTKPAGFDHLEVPQVHQLGAGGEDVLLFSCHPDRTTVRRRTGGPLSGTWTVAGGDVQRGWDVDTAVPFAHPSLYAARLIRDREGGLCLLGFRDREHGVFHGEIVDPIPVSWTNRRLIERLS